MKKQFPHFTRTNPASFLSGLLRGLLLIGILGVCSLNIIVFDQESKKVLGATDEMQIRELELREVSNQYSYWQQVASRKPEYQDAFISLSLLAYQLGLHEDASVYIAKAEVLNPNNAYIADIRELLAVED